jgi:hypothetical protein
MALRGMNFGRETDLTAMVRQPLGAGVQIFFMLWLGGNAGKAKVIAKFREKTLLVAFQVIKNTLHGRKAR